MADISISTNITGNEQVRKALDQIGREAAELKAEFQKLSSATGLTNTQLRQQTTALKGQQQALSLQTRAATEAGRASRNFAGAIRGMTSTLGSGQKAFSGLSLSLESFRGLLAGVGVVEFTRSLFQAGVEAENLEKRLRLTGVENTQSILDNLAITADILGVRTRDLRGSFGQLAVAVNGSGVSFETAKDLAVGLAAAQRTLGITSEQARNATFALTQMLSKGRIQAEELTGQFAEAVPGGLQIFARALGVSTSELLDMSKKGELLADQVLPKVAAELLRTAGGITRADGLQAALNRLLTSWDNLLIALGETGVFNAMERILTNLGTIVHNASVLFGRARTAVLEFLQAIGLAQKTSLPALAGEIERVSKQIAKTTGALEEWERLGLDANAAEARKALDEYRSELNQLNKDYLTATESVSVLSGGVTGNTKATETNNVALKRAQEQRRQFEQTTGRVIQGEESLEQIVARVTRVQEGSTRASRDNERAFTAQEMATFRLRAALDRFGERQRDATASVARMREQLIPGLGELNRYEDQQRQLAEAVRVGAISQEEANDLLGRAADAYREARGGAESFSSVIADMLKAQFDPIKDLRSLFQNTFGELKNTISEFIQTGKLSFSGLWDAIKSGIANFLASAAVNALMQWLGSFLTGFGGIGATIGGFLTSAAGGAAGGAAAGAAGGAAAGGGGLLAGVGAALGFGGTAAATGGATAGAALGGGATAGLGGFTGSTIAVGGGGAAGGAGGTLAAIAPFAAAALPVGAFLFRTLFGEEFDPNRVAANMRAQGVPEAVIQGKAQIARANQLRRVSGKSSELLQAEARQRDLSSRSSRFSRRQTGGSFVATQPTFMEVGEMGPERVTVNPLGRSRGASFGGGGSTINMDLRGAIIANDRAIHDLARAVKNVIDRETTRLGRF